MTDADLRAAADRVRRAGRIGLVTAYGAYPALAEKLIADDHARLAAEWLAEHPEDSDQPVDEAFLRGLGFRPLKSFAFGLVHHDPDTDIRFRLRCEDMPNVATGCAWSLESLGKGGEESTVLPCSPTTRGAVRALAAIGIPLAEPA